MARASGLGTRACWTLVVCKSTDSGLAWTEANTGLPATSDIRA
jgi:hypothetical protein